MMFITYVDIPQPFCPEIPGLLVENLEKYGKWVGNIGVIACTVGPGLETLAKIEMSKLLGCDLVEEDSGS